LSDAEEPRAPDRLRLAIDVAEPALARQIAALLGTVEGVELVAADDAPDAVITVPRSAAGDRQEPDVALTGRELEVLALVAEGASNKQIARRLGISTHTAKYHVASLMEKLDAVSRTDAVAHAARLGVLHL
jgi:DNA-binding CsgD family transcriptional regulator